MAEELRLDSISFSYTLPGGKALNALSSVTLGIAPGEILCVSGANGSGKSTLAQLCGAVLQPTSGSILYGGMPVSGRRSRIAFRRAVGILFQSPEDQLFAETVTKDISFGPSNRGEKGAPLRQTVLSAAEMAGVDLQAVGDRSPFSLSMGEKRRVALAGVLALKPEVLILDEPFIGLDHDGKRQLADAVRRLNAVSGTTVMIVTHELSDIWHLAHRFAVLDNGTLTGPFTPSEYWATVVRRGGGMKPPQWSMIAEELRVAGVAPRDPSDPRELALSIARLKGVGRES